MITYKSVDLKNLSEFLEREAPRAFAYAASSTLNSTAYFARRRVIEKLPEQFTLRNSWTKRSMQYEKVPRGLKDIGKMTSSTGTTLQYMAEQEFGRLNQTTGKEGLPIPTAASAGQTGTKRTRPVRKNNRMGNITLRQKTVGFSRLPRKKRNAAIVRTAAAKKWRYVFLKLDRLKGIFKVTGPKKRPIVRLLHNMNKKTTRVPPRPWLKPAADAIAEDMPGIFNKACEQQVARRLKQKMRRRY